MFLFSLRLCARRITEKFYYIFMADIVPLYTVTNVLAPPSSGRVSEIENSMYITYQSWKMPE